MFFEINRAEVVNALTKMNAYLEREEAQLSQRDRSTLRVIEYFAKSFKIIRNDAVEYRPCVRPYISICLYLVPFLRY